MPDHPGSEIYVDPPQLVTGGRELAAAGEQLRELRAYAEQHAADPMWASGAGTGRALAAFEETWRQYRTGLMFVQVVMTLAGERTQAAAAHYTQSDLDSAGRIAETSP